MRAEITRARSTYSRSSQRSNSREKVGRGRESIVEGAGRSFSLSGFSSPHRRHGGGGAGAVGEKALPVRGRAERAQVAEGELAEVAGHSGHHSGIPACARPRVCEVRRLDRVAAPHGHVARGRPQAAARVADERADGPHTDAQQAAAGRLAAEDLPVPGARRQGAQDGPPCAAEAAQRHPRHVPAEVRRAGEAVGHARQASGDRAAAGLGDRGGRAHLRGPRGAAPRRVQHQNRPEAPRPRRQVELQHRQGAVGALARQVEGA
jgi:hypothetical protein